MLEINYLRAIFSWDTIALIAMLLFIIFTCTKRINGNDGEHETKDPQEQSSAYGSDDRAAVSADKLLVALSDGSDKRIHMNVSECLDRLDELVAHCNRMQDHKNTKKGNFDDRKYEQECEEKYMIYQEIVRLIFVKYSTNDEICISALTLLTIIANEEKVLERILYEADIYGINLPILVAKESLKRIRLLPDRELCYNSDNDEVEENQDWYAAELQKHTALFLGSLCNSCNSNDMATLAVDEGGLELILEAASFFRMHMSTLHWLMWALFTICYDNMNNKSHFIRLGGITKTCDVLKGIYEIVESSQDDVVPEKMMQTRRHATALLYDVLRNTETAVNNSHKMQRLRAMAVNAGLHDVLLTSIKLCNDDAEAVDVYEMSREMLLGTGYSGVIPKSIHKIHWAQK